MVLEYFNWKKFGWIALILGVLNVIYLAIYSVIQINNNVFFEFGSLDYVYIILAIIGYLILILIIFIIWVLISKFKNIQ